MNNISEAAKRLNISQAALSKAIASIEDELGVALFDRKGRHIYLNRYGELMLNYIDSAFRELNEGERIIKRINRYRKWSSYFCSNISTCYAITHSKLCVTTSQY